MKRISGFPVYERLHGICRETGFDFPTEVVTQHSSTPPWRLRQCTLVKLINGKKGSFSEQEIQCEFSCLKHKYANYVFIYTDGAKTTDGVGCAFFHGDRCQQFKLPGQCSVFTAEAFALLQALIYSENNHLAQCVICTDSLSVVTALRYSATDHPCIISIQDCIHRLTGMGWTIIVAWIPGHCNIYGNEVADANAKLAVGMNGVYDIQLGPKEYYPVVRTHIRDLFNRIWTAYNPNSTLRSIKDCVGSWMSSQRRNRREEIVLCRLRLGHTRYTHSYLMDRTPRPDCEQCRCPLTTQHILTECPIYAYERQMLVTVCQEQHVQFCLKSLIGNEMPAVLDQVFTYLRHCQLLKRL